MRPDILQRSTLPFTLHWLILTAGYDAPVNEPSKYNSPDQFHVSPQKLANTMREHQKKHHMALISEYHPTF
jgi:hypothetical protein